MFWLLDIVCNNTSIGNRYSFMFIDRDQFLLQFDSCNEPSEDPTCRMDDGPPDDVGGNMAADATTGGSRFSFLLREEVREKTRLRMPERPSTMLRLISLSADPISSIEMTGSLWIWQNRVEK